MGRKCNIVAFLTFGFILSWLYFKDCDNDLFVNIYESLPDKNYNGNESISENRIISMSLFGSNQRYTNGAVENAKLVNNIFPGWKLRLYMTKRNEPTSKLLVPSNIIQKLFSYNVEVFWVDTEKNKINPRMWRFLVADDLRVDRFIVRDTDSRLIIRDAVEVNQWIKSKKAFHCMRDHPDHKTYPIFAGMWGAETKKLKGLMGYTPMFNLMLKYSQNKFQDQVFLKNEIWPKIQNDAYCSDSFFCDSFPFYHSFTMSRSKDMEFVGEVFNEDGIPKEKDRLKLFKTSENPKCVSQKEIKYNRNERIYKSGNITFKIKH